MMAMILVSSVFIGLVLLGLWPVVRDSWDARVRRKAHERTAATMAAPAAEPSTLEGSVVTGLFQRQISSAQYRATMERLAADDNDRHPLRVPPETGRDAGKA
ncbi:hypothetical protein JIG36_12100 [Actinoplanes sp. LDG1-06]|uniref:Uncharacterized protein n=1 Tax=Paractinoplanes ovalisporus TaxID=2810368 RepID=A0ABS2AAD1_9ACTN|nr:hypothetical protein [Actinoplanes ovalisporus]MBM2616298.1 hypothetical protein [Actinoplanes ovalisporus]